MNNNKYNSSNNDIFLQGGGGGGGNFGAKDPPEPVCCGEVPTPPGPPDTYWVWPPYIKNASPIGYEKRWYQRDFVAENLFIPKGTIEYTLLYFEELTEEYGGVISSVWAPRMNFLIAPGNGFFDDLIIIGDPKGWKASTFASPRPVQINGSQYTPFMLKGTIQLNNLCKIKKAGGYIFEVMKYINSNNLAGDGSTKHVGEYTSIFSGSEFITQTTLPDSDTIISPTIGYDFQTTSTTTDPNQVVAAPTEPEGMLIIKNYILKLVATTGDEGFINAWNAVNCTNNITSTPPKNPENPVFWNLDELREGLKDPWLGWNIDGRPNDALLAGVGGDPGGNFNIMDPTKPVDTIEQIITFSYHFITARTYYIDICEASNIYAEWRIVNNPNYDLEPELTDYTGLRKAVDINVLKQNFNNILFKQYLINTNQLTNFIKPYRGATNDTFTEYAAFYSSYSRTVPIQSWSTNAEIGIGETKLVNGTLMHRISWEEAGLEFNNSLSTIMAQIYGENLSVGPNTIEEPSGLGPYCIKICPEIQEPVEACDCGYDIEMVFYPELEQSCPQKVCSDCTTTTPAPTGACCYPTGIISGENDCVEDMTEAECDLLGGTIHIGEDCSQISSSCLNLGACCYYDPSDSSIYYGCSGNISMLACEQDSGTHHPAQTCEEVNCQPSTTTSGPTTSTTPEPVQRWAVTDVAVSSNNAYVTITKTAIQQCEECVAPNCPVTEITSCSIVGDPTKVISDCGGVGDPCLEIKLENTEVTLSDWEKTNETVTFKEYLYPEPCDQNMSGSYCNNGQCIIATWEQYNIAKTINPSIGNWSPETCNQ